jgi:hypothetical protein
VNSAGTGAPENGNTSTCSKRCSGELPVQRQQDVVDDQEAVLRVGGDPADLLGRQAQVQRVHHAAGRRDAEVALQVRMVVPAQRGHAVALAQAECRSAAASARVRRYHSAVGVSHAASCRAAARRSRCENSVPGPVEQAGSVTAARPSWCYLAGAVWHGTATRLSDIHIQLFCDDPKSAEIALIDHNVAYEPRTVTGFQGESVEALSLSVPSRELRASIGIHLMVYDHDDLRGALKADAKGRTPRGDLCAVQNLVREDPP